MVGELQRERKGERLKQQPNGRNLGKSAGQGSTEWEARGEGAGSQEPQGGKAGRGQVVVGGAEKGPEGCGAGSLPQASSGGGPTREGRSQRRRACWVFFLSSPSLSFLLLSIIRSQGAALTAINKAFMLQREAEIISSRLPALPGQRALALSSPAACGPTWDTLGNGWTGPGRMFHPPQTGSV